MFSKYLEKVHFINNMTLVHGSVHFGVVVVDSL